MNRIAVEEKIDYAKQLNWFDSQLVPEIFGEKDFSKLLDMVYQLPKQDRDIIFSKEKKFEKFPILGDKNLNKAGLHIFRMLLANTIYKFAFDKKDKMQDFYNDGYIVIPDFLDSKEFKKISKNCQREISDAGNKSFIGKKYWIELSKKDKFLYDFFDLSKCQELFRIVNAIDNYEFHAKRVERVIHKTFDIQKQIHEDTFHPTIKFWYFYDNVDSLSGPTFYSKGSSVPNFKRFKWEYDKSLIALQSNYAGTREGSFRIEPEELEALGYNSMSPVCCEKNSLVIFNTMGFHCRGAAADGTIRDAMMGIFRMNPFTL